MHRITVLAVGGIKEPFYRDAIAEYVKRLGKWAKVTIEEVDEASFADDEARKRETEGTALLRKMRGKVVLTDVKGKKVRSEDIADIIEDASLSGEGEITFVIGGSNGVAQSVKDKADRILSFGDITLPHQLFRVVLMEQLYRAMTILAGTPYHK